MYQQDNKANLNLQVKIECRMFNEIKLYLRTKANIVWLNEAYFYTRINSVTLL